MLGLPVGVYELGREEYLSMSVGELRCFPNTWGSCTGPL